MRSIVIAPLVIALALALALGGTAAAQPSAPAPSPAAQPSPTASPPPPPAEEPPYQSTALLLSFGGSLAAWSTMLIGANVDHGNNAAVPLGAIATLLAPSFGQWYAGEAFSRGFRTRLIGAGIIIAAAIPALSCEDECHPGGPLEVAFYTGIGLYFFGTLDDIITAPGAARAAQPHRTIGLAPMIRHGGSGLVLTGQF